MSVKLGRGSRVWQEHPWRLFLNPRQPQSPRDGSAAVTGRSAALLPEEQDRTVGGVAHAFSWFLLSPADTTERAVPCSGKVLEGFPTSSLPCLGWRLCCLVGWSFPDFCPLRTLVLVANSHEPSVCRAVLDVSTCGTLTPASATGPVCKWGDSGAERNGILSSGSNWGDSAPGDIWYCLRTFF